jgi:gamma-glutamylcyclotransferase (GGCT)/AIG2-like uncharacterized protein YtfP
VAERLFVYGTLRPPSGGSNPVLSFNYPKIVPFLRSVEPAVLSGAELYDLGSFPAAIRGAGEIIGNLLEIDPAAFEVLDPLEGHPEVYRREGVRVRTEAGEVQAWIYWAPEELAQMGDRIENGDWLSRVP